MEHDVAQYRRGATRCFMLTTSTLQHRATGDASENLDLLLEQWRQNEGNRTYVAKLRQWDSGQQIYDTPRMPAEQLDHQRRKPRWAPKIFSAFLDKLSFLYARDPVRSARNATQDRAWTSALWDFRYQGNLNAIMMEADRMARRDGTVLAVVQPASSSQPGVYGVPDPDGVDVLLRSRDQFEVLEHPDDPRHVGAALVWWGRYDVELPTGQTSSTDEFWYFDDEVSGRIVDGKFDQLEPHNLGTCPVVTFRNQYPSDSPLGHPSGGQDIISNIETLNGYMEELVWTGKIQRGQPWMANKREGQDIGLAPDNVIGVAEAGGFGIVANAANIGGMIDVLQVMLDTLAYGLGLPAGTLNVRSVQAPTSAAVIQASDLALQQDRARRERVARVWEADLHRLASTVHEAAQLNPTVRVEYTTFPLPLTHSEKMSEATFLVDKSLASREEAKRIIQPHKTTADILDSLAKAAEDAEFFTDLAAKRAGHLMDTAEDGRNNEDMSNV